MQGSHPLRRNPRGETYKYPDHCVKRDSGRRCGEGDPAGSPEGPRAQRSESSVLGSCTDSARAAEALPHRQTCAESMNHLRGREGTVTGVHGGLGKVCASTSQSVKPHSPARIS